MIRERERERERERGRERERERGCIFAPFFSLESHSFSASVDTIGRRERVRERANGRERDVHHIGNTIRSRGHLRLFFLKDLKYHLSSFVYNRNRNYFYMLAIHPQCIVGLS